ncbi:hypothetical protein LCGC14_0930850 [marine sediment metagenome]|uniref:Uncharacterized protein n=1 Tax=marine sediment metagenome TaxID=412755 RepID=A0A0F9R6I6_9ZZZZ|nr:hypothetical protein [archaeon]
MLIFTFEGEKSGVSQELAYCIHENKDFLIFAEEKTEGENLFAGSTIIEGRLRKIGNRLIKFPENDYAELHYAVFARIHDFFL